jgi:hypothetical protein
MFYNTLLDSIILLSVFELLNICTVWLFWDIDSLTNNYDLDTILCLLSLLGVNYSYFFFEKRYERVIHEYDGKSELKKTVGTVLTITYVLITLYLFFSIHSVS